MLLRVSQLRLPLEYNDKKLLRAVVSKLRCHVSSVKNIEILSRAVDARSAKHQPVYTVSVECEVAIDEVPSHLRANEVKVLEKREELCRPEVDLMAVLARPLVVGAGPAGLLAALQLAQAGLKPLMIDRGAESGVRAGQVDKFWKDGVLDEESNVLFGEGGAGLFSDGKLTARSKDNYRMNSFFDVLVECGADSDIKIDNLPHVGSDKLMEICPKLRQMIIDAGGEVRFNCRLDRIVLSSDKTEVVAAVINGEEIKVSDCVLAIGHSARDTYRMLYDAGVKLEAKAFAVGVRVEVPQKQVNRSQWGRWCNLSSLGAASYRLTRKPEQAVRGCYSFCMCPGGTVISCASEAEKVTSNGMSLQARDLPFSNAAFLVGVTPDDFPKTEPSELAGIEYQRRIEEKVYAAAGYGLPASSLNDFVKGKSPKIIPAKRSFENSVPADLNKILPKEIASTLKSSIPKMLRKLRAVELDKVLLYGAETRSSSPVRIVRTDDCTAEGITGLYPTGEGAGYAGGIVSSGIDGIRVAEAIIEKYSAKHKK